MAIVTSLAQRSGIRGTKLDPSENGFSLYRHVGVCLVHRKPATSCATSPSIHIVPSNSAIEGSRTHDFATRFRRYQILKSLLFQLQRISNTFEQSDHGDTGLRKPEVLN